MRYSIASGLALVGGLVALTGCASSTAPSTDAQRSATSVLAALQSDRAALVKKPDGNYRFTMTGTDPQMALFADRPVRKAQTIPTTELADLWTTGGAESFANEPPNAAITVHTPDGGMHIGTAVLTNPDYDAAAATLGFTVSFLGAALPQKPLTDASVLIDNTSLDLGVLPDDPDSGCIEYGEQSFCNDGATQPTQTAVPSPSTSTAPETELSAPSGLGDFNFNN